MDIVHLAFMVSPLLGAAAGYLVDGLTGATSGFLIPMGPAVVAWFLGGPDETVQALAPGPSSGFVSNAGNQR